MQSLNFSLIYYMTGNTISVHCSLNRRLQLGVSLLTKDHQRTTLGLYICYYRTQILEHQYFNMYLQQGRDSIQNMFSKSSRINLCKSNLKFKTALFRLNSRATEISCFKTFSDLMCGSYMIKSLADSSKTGSKSFKSIYIARRQPPRKRGITPFFLP